MCVRMDGTSVTTGTVQQYTVSETTLDGWVKVVLGQTARWDRAIPANGTLIGHVRDNLD